MITVYTEEELKAALEAGKENKILAVGDFANKMRDEIEKKAKKKKRVKRAGIAAAVLSAIAMPFTGGLSAIGIGATVATIATTGTALTISTAELALIVGGALCAMAMKKDYNVKWTEKGLEFSKVNGKE